MAAYLGMMLAPVFANFASRWPDGPVPDDKGQLFRELQASLGAKPEEIVGKMMQHHHRILEGDPNAPPSMNDIATFNIILFTSIALVLVFYFSIMATVNMDYANDSLLYSKSKND